MAALRSVHVVGGGLHRYQRPSDATYVKLGLVAVRRALADAGIDWSAVQSAYVGTAQVGMAAAGTMLRYLGATGIPVTQVDSASASGAAAFRQAIIEIGAGISDVVVAAGVDKPDPRPGGPTKAEVPDLLGRLLSPAIYFALEAEKYLRHTGATAAQVASVAVKNHRNGAANPYGQRRKARTIEEVLASQVIAGVLTRLQCAPRGEGAAAVVLMSEAAMRRHSVAKGRAARVVASAAGTDRHPSDPTELTRTMAHQAYEQAGIGPGDTDVIELHDAFSVEELLYLEAMDVCAAGEAAALTQRGEFDIGGRRAVSPSGGLLAMGHPIGPTGIGQVVEILRQLRGTAGARQHPRARIGLAHLVGVDGSCLVHILTRQGDGRPNAP
jgi:acetyl-CoA acetyltransferase